MRNKIVIQDTKKSLLIEGDLHNELKVICFKKHKKISGVVSDLIKLYLKSYTKIQKMIDEMNHAEYDSFDEFQEKKNKVKTIMPYDNVNGDDE